MRTFHTGGVAAANITQGLPRVEELFEARKPKKTAIIAECAGSVTIQDVKKIHNITIKPDDGGEDDKPTAALTPEFVCPLGGTLVKDYSADIPVFSMTMEDYRVHCGIDVGADAGTEVLAAADGEITDVYYDPMMGQTVEITHAGGFVTVYRNLQTKMPSSVSKGIKVSAGETIGYVGDTALIEISDSPHLHFEMRKDGESINPLSHFELPEKNAGSDYED
jgi:murein DD-endopeptidase MepM/ murein hydrolase activator NlpD